MSKINKKIDKEFRLSSWAINNKTTIYVLMFLILYLGITSYFTMPRENFPEINETKIYISSVYPGNTAEDIEKLITNPLEDKLKSVSNVVEIISTSQEDYSIITVEFDENIPVEKAKQKVKDEIDQEVAGEDWPTFNGAKVTPNVFELSMSEEVPILNINISGNYPVSKLKEFGEYLQDEIEDLSEIKKVDIRGAQDKEIEVAVDIYKMMAAKVSFDDITNSINRGNVTMSAGNFITSQQRRTLRIIGEIDSPEELLDFVIKSEKGNSIYLKDVAKISFKDKDKTTYAREKGAAVVMLDVKKRGGENMVAAADKVGEIVRLAKKNDFPQDLDVTITNDQSPKTIGQVDDLVNNIIFGVVLVVIVLMFFLGFKNAIFVGFAIPMSMFMSLMILGALGYTLNTMVLFGLIMGLGMLVDNGIVVVENVYRLMDEEGLTRIEAAKKGIGEIAFPIIISTATTVAAFIPLGLWPGIMGQFMVILPITLSVVLGSSLFVAIFFNSVLVSQFMSIEDKNMPLKNIIRITSIMAVIGILIFFLGGEYKGIGTLILFTAIMFWVYRFVLRKAANYFQKNTLVFLENWYERQLKRALTGWRPYVLVVATFVILFIAFTGFGWSLAEQRTKVEFFPDNKPNQIIVYIEYPEGTDIEKTNEITLEIEQKVYEVLNQKKYIDDGYNFLVESTVSQVGEGAGNPEKDGGSSAEMPHKGKITASMREFKYRRGEDSEILRQKVQAALVGIYPGVLISVEKDANGPPAGSPINIELNGEDYEELILTAERMRDYLNTQSISGVDELKIDVNKSKPGMQVLVDRKKAGELGVSTGQIGQQLRASIFGNKAGIYKEKGEDYDINIRFNKDNRYSEDILYDQNLIFRDPNNGTIKEIPISSVTSNSRTTTFNVIKHKDFKRIVTIYSGLSSGYVDAGAIVNQIVSEMKSFNEDISMIDIDYTGQIEEQNKNQAFLLKAFGTGLLLIFLLLILQFNSISKPTIIMIAIILSLIGVFGYLAISGNSFVILMTMMGIIALSGIVVNNGVVLLDYSEILLNRKKLDVSNSKKKLIELKYESIVESCKSRLRPVLLTAITTIGGLVPLSAGFNINFYTLFSDFDPNIYWGGDNFVFWGPLATTVISGLVVATFLTLFVVPSLFMMIEKFKLWIGLRYR